MLVRSKWVLVVGLLSISVLGCTAPSGSPNSHLFQLDSYCGVEIAPGAQVPAYGAARLYGLDNGLEPGQGCAFWAVNRISVATTDGVEYCDFHPGIGGSASCTEVDPYLVQGWHTATTHLTGELVSTTVTVEATGSGQLLSFHVP